MKCGVLFSGGKDSTYAAYLAKKSNFELSCLITIFSENLESYMFHTVCINEVLKQAQAMNIPLIIQETKGEKEEELEDLEKALLKAKKEFCIDTIVTGAVCSNYQLSRIQKICDKLKLQCFNPLWQKDPNEYWDELLKNKFEIIITKVSANGLDEKWLGQKIDKKSLDNLKQVVKKFRIHLSFEGGEAETFVLD
ncbi:MAG: diphthine--ammonia ligase, partial [Candidatus Thermoplasmatota archaeon]|nr:diphthine--ammonia ligase [Candidatus Thermoplasmatota archaeon]